MADLDKEHAERLLAEYREAAADGRLNAGLLFGQLTVYLAATGGLIQVAWWGSPVAAAGIMLSLTFAVIAERCGDFAVSADIRAKQIEKHLGFTLYTSRPGARIPHCTRINATRAIFACGLVGWMLRMAWCFSRHQ